MFLLDTLLKDKCMCLQGKLKLLVTHPTGQVQYWNIFVPLLSSGARGITFGPRHPLLLLFVYSRTDGSQICCAYAQIHLSHRSLPAEGMQ